MLKSPETAMGVKMNAQVNFDTEYINAVKEMSEIVYHRVFSALNQFPKLYALMPMARRERKVIKILHDFTNTVISQKRNELVANNYNYLESKEKCEGDSLNAYGTKFRMSFLDMLFQIRVNGEPLSHSDIREEVDTFMFAVSHFYNLITVSFDTSTDSVNRFIKISIFSVKMTFTDFVTTNRLGSQQRSQ